MTETSSSSSSQQKDITGKNRLKPAYLRQQRPLGLGIAHLTECVCVSVPAAVSGGAGLNPISVRADTQPAATQEMILR